MSDVASAPEPPDDPGRADEAGRWPRRPRGRTAGLVTIGAVTVVVAALVIVPTVIGEDTDGGSGVMLMDETPETEETTSNAELAPYTCPETGESGSLQAPRELPGGAVLARICPSGSILWTPPQDALETGLDELVVQINAADPLRAEVKCPPLGGPEFTVTFQYEDGNSADIRGSLSDCDAIFAGGEQRAGAAALVALYGDLLAEQRTANDGSDIEVDPTCGSAPGQDGWFTILDVDRRMDLVDGVLCDHVDQVREIQLSESQLTQINEDFTANATKDTQTCGAFGASVSIRGVNAFGDPVELVLQCATFRSRGWSWAPTPDVQRMLDGLLD